MRRPWRLTVLAKSERIQRADVIPRRDTRPHVLGRCWCEPTVERVRLGRVLRFLVAHNAGDGRELIEEHGIN